MTDASQPILRINALTKRFDDFTALHGVDLNVAEGEFLAIVGPSGSGKTTLIRILVGMDELSDGAVWLRNTRIDVVPANKRPTCMVFQSLALFPHRTVGQNIEFPLKLRKVPPAERKARALELLDTLRLPRDYYDKRIQQCSGGEKQRVALARALAFDPEILFFDEPLSALDYRLRKTLEKELKDLHRRTGKTFIYITHSLEEAMVMSDRIAIMKAGRFEQIAPAEEIYARPVSKFVAEFMGEVNFFDLRNGQAEGLLMTPETAAALAGRSGTLTIRPESLRTLPEGQAADLTFEGEIVAEYLLGSRMQYRMMLATGQEMIVEVLRENGVAGGIGAALRVGCDLSAAHLIEEARDAAA
ncbi:ABC transporter ATP-binding protein [Tropicimonas sediminicola]|uniref:Spermidine/putrescine transport system ATP-binding protein n=1 Tax=Tropicimonas sediminicola TaxID=1031541 RepID=A0A239C9R3_9RHOB|nr:ABC transporter ATP-binding protein [Tropicimonas sediminicola]SNS16986.1 spermidine/putrescine transport system ATP-binding protein [Tropicimonas sediminicola]